ncbi:hypothetical protein L596_000898 [Steinernema carpocapsae]|uniref:Protein kinase domain-containing protein n=1 Tax=Steinernema carpocapsae TaxID=34508 RepID=A0A4U8UJV7_STECR|nr:hypothetical protein L596_000898 [Steinernema carpocapsae]
MLDDEKMKQKANKKQKAEKEREEQAEIEKANKQRLDRLNDQKADKEKERQRLKSCTAPEVEGLGEAIDVRAMDDSKLTVFVKTDVVAPHRTTKHPLCSEWIGYINHKGQVLVSEWRFEHTLGKERKASDSPNLKKFEKDLDEFVANVLRRLRSLDTMDQSMYAYQFVHLVKKSATPTNFKCSLLVGQLIPSEHQPLEIVMRDVKKRPKFFMPKFASAAVCALKWLHDQQLSHGALDKATAWFNKDYADPAFLISDFFILPGLVKLAKQFSATISPEGSPALEAEELEVMKKAQQKDRFAVGSLMMDIHSESASDTKNIPNLCQDFIKTCQNEAFTTDHLLEHRYINHGFFEQLHVSRSSLSEDPVGNYESTASSRLMKDWAMRKRLGGGGFGDVILAKNKLDGNDYAIKRIKLSPGQSELTGRITQEAKVFSRLNHPNIVRYYNAWIENVIETGSDESASTIPTMSAPAEAS